MRSRRLALAATPLLATMAMATADVHAAKSTKADPCAGAVLWTSAPNYLPLALVRGASITRPRGECDGAFWNQSERFAAVDARGAKVGVAMRGKDGTALRRVSGEGGVGLFVEGDAWKGLGASDPTFEPDAEQRRGFDALYVRAAKHHPVKTTFFRAAAKQGKASVGAPTIYAAGSGKALVVGYLDARGRWQRAYLDRAWDLGATSKGKEPYRLRAVLDLNGDGRPEVIAQLRDAENLGYDVVLSPSRGGRRYRLVAENPDDGP